MTTRSNIPARPGETHSASAPRGWSGRYVGGVHGDSEPPLAEMMADDVMQRVMARDGVGAEQLLSLLDEVRTRLGWRTAEAGGPYSS